MMCDDHAGVRLEIKQVRMLLCAYLGYAYALGQPIGEVKTGVLEIQLSPLDTRKVEQVTDQSLKMFGLTLHNIQTAQIIALRRFDQRTCIVLSLTCFAQATIVAPYQVLRVALNCCQRRAQFM